MENVIVCVTSLATFNFLARSVTVNPSNSVLYLCWCSSVDGRIFSCFCCEQEICVSVPSYVGNSRTLHARTLHARTLHALTLHARTSHYVRTRCSPRRTLHCWTPTLIRTWKLIISPVEPNIIVHKLIFISSIERFDVIIRVVPFKCTRISSIHSLNTHKGTVRCQGKILTVQKKSKHV